MDGTVNLVTLRDPGERAASPVWPDLRRDGYVRLEAAELVHWHGKVDVSQFRPVDEDKDYDRTDYDITERRSVRMWNLVGTADCLITDRRLIYKGRRLDSAGSPAGFLDILKSATVGLRKDSEASNSSDAPAVVGHVRFEWVRRVTVERTSIIGVEAATLSLLCGDDGQMLAVVLLLDPADLGGHANVEYTLAMAHALK